MSFLFCSFFYLPILLSLFCGSNSNNSCPAQHEQQCSLFSWPRIKNILVIVVALSILLLLHERTNQGIPRTERRRRHCRCVSVSTGVVSYIQFNSIHLQFFSQNLYVVSSHTMNHHSVCLYRTSRVESVSIWNQTTVSYHYHDYHQLMNTLLYHHHYTIRDSM